MDPMGGGRSRHLTGLSKTVCLIISFEPFMHPLAAAAGLQAGVLKGTQTAVFSASMSDD